jgi:antitoxin (DNA-binding transcriptional repressor) of toxin-antitoxin stability system
MKRVSTSHARAHFGELLENVATLGRVEIVRNGRVVAIMIPPPAGGESLGHPGLERGSLRVRTPMIPPALARAARIISAPVEFDDDWA